MVLPYVDKTNVLGTQYLIRDSSTREMINDEYIPAAQYTKGDVVIYENVLYRCTSSSTVTGVWDATKWEKTNINEICESLKSELEELKGNVDPKNVLFNKNSIDNVLSGYGNNITVSVFAASLRRNVMNIYMEFVTNSEITLNPLFDVKSLYAPPDYVIASVRENVSPYKEVATLWINSGGHLIGYGILPNKKYYMSVSYAVVL